MSEKKLRIRIEVREWQEFDVEPEWFAGEGGETPDELWDSVVEMYGEHPEMAFDAVEGESWQVNIKRLGTDKFSSWTHLQPGELMPGDDEMKTPEDELRAAFHWIADLPEEDDYPDTLWGRFWEKYRELFPEEMAEKTPEDWATAKGIVIVDPDGWRDFGAPDWDEPITEEEFDRRAAVSTIANRKEDGSW